MISIIIPTLLVSASLSQFSSFFYSQLSSPYPPTLLNLTTLFLLLFLLCCTCAAPPNLISFRFHQFLHLSISLSPKTLIAHAV